jgi:hypothetical protein
VARYRQCPACGRFTYEVDADTCENPQCRIAVRRRRQEALDGLRAGTRRRGRDSLDRLRRAPGVTARGARQAVCWAARAAGAVAATGMMAVVLVALLEAPSYLLVGETVFAVCWLGWMIGPAGRDWAMRYGGARVRLRPTRRVYLETSSGRVDAGRGFLCLLGVVPVAPLGLCVSDRGGAVSQRHGRGAPAEWARVPSYLVASYDRESARTSLRLMWLRPLVIGGVGAAIAAAAFGPRGVLPGWILGLALDMLLDD